MHLCRIHRLSADGEGVLEAAQARRNLERERGLVREATDTGRASDWASRRLEKRSKALRPCRFGGFYPSVMKASHVTTGFSTGSDGWFSLAMKKMPDLGQSMAVVACSSGGLPARRENTDLARSSGFWLDLKKDDYRSVSQFLKNGWEISGVPVASWSGRNGVAVWVVGVDLPTDAHIRAVALQQPWPWLGKMKFLICCSGGAPKIVLMRPMF
ncbi:hypothetical protein ACLOJK_003667 [Asimina triloba]